MAVSLLRVPLSPLWITSLLSRGCSRNSYGFKPLRVTSFSLSTSAAAAEVGSWETAQKWESIRKKKVVMRVGYVGSDYRGLLLLILCVCVCVSNHSCFFVFCDKEKNILFLLSSLFLIFGFDGFCSNVVAGLQIQRNEPDISSEKLLFL